jgi:hypothetical protein
VEGASDLALGLEVGEQGEMEVPIFCEGQMRPDSVDRDAQKRSVELLELGEQLLVQAN